MQTPPPDPAAKYSPAPWAYEYNPYIVRPAGSPLDSGAELPAFEVFDDDGNKVFDTNEDMPAEVQEANARLAAAAPRLLASLVTCANLLADFDESDGEKAKPSARLWPLSRKQPGGRHDQ